MTYSVGHHAMDAMIEEQLLIIEVEGCCKPYKYNWSKLRHTPEAKEGPSGWVKLWKKCNHIGPIDKVTMLTSYSYRRSEDIPI